MNAASIFVDGEHGTTGLKIVERLSQRVDLRLIRLGEAERKNAALREQALNDADIAILCLPDLAAREAVGLVKNPRTRIIDASSAHRTDPDWIYGFPEFGADHAQRIAHALRVSNPGCYATGAVALLRPLVSAGLIDSACPLSIHAISGYSGGGKALIAAFEDARSEHSTHVPVRLYALGLDHKHTEEIRVHAGLSARPLFSPSVGRFKQGMLVSVSLHLWAQPRRPTLQTVHAALSSAYGASPAVEVASWEHCRALATASSLDQALPEPEALNGTDRLRLFVFGNQQHEQAWLLAQLDNLGKGAAGQAVQCLDLMLQR